uniref:Putative reverse transcriptase domain-containing protein n=1 Tax=Tanacetum cinerariifolium TaxID=118510 RepID=A0A699GYN5_TANCI|nr:putative reverse transcriptase domain-containing protein [Tanacetum cinerariifolium]
MHAYYAKESPISPPVITPPSPMLSPMFNSQEFFLPEELLPPKKRRGNRSSSSTPTLPQEFDIGECSRKSSLERHKEQIEEILNHLDELYLDRIENIEDNIEGLGKGIEEAYKLSWIEFKKLFIKKYCPRTEIQKMEDEFYYLSVKGNDLKTHVTTSKPPTLKEAINRAQRLMDQVTKHISVQVSSDQKQKFEDKKTFNNNYPNSRSNNCQDNRNNRNNDYRQQQNKRQEIVRSYAATPAENSRALCKSMLKDHQQRQGRTYMLRDRNAHQNPNVVTAQVMEKKSEDKRLEDILVVREFLDVFLEDLPGLPPVRQVESQIDLILGATPVDRASYRLAPSEMQELSDQIQGLAY